MPGMRTFLRTPTVICVALSFPVVNGSFIKGDAGNCSPNEFWYPLIRNCVPLGKRSFESVPPHGTACPLGENWYWSSRHSLCLPASPDPDVTSPVSVLCPSHHTWDASTSRCSHVEGSAACGTTEFWFSEKGMCLPHHDATPRTARCPSGWYWSAQLASCAPAHPEGLSSPTCGGSFVWSPSALMCQRAPRRSPPSTTSQRRNLKSRLVSLCPAGLDACPILSAGDLSDYECIDSKYDLQHCGGCSVDGRGEDCTAIKGVWNVECFQARCSVLTCMVGYVPSFDQRTCIKL